MTRYEYFEKIANNWSVTKHPITDKFVDIYLTTPALSLIKDPNVLVDVDDELYKEFEEIKSILPMSCSDTFKLAHVPRGARMICVTMGRPLGKSQMQSLLESITIKYIVLHFDAKLHKLFSDKDFTADGLYDYISVSADDWTAKITPAYEDDVINDPYRLQIVYDDEEDDKYFIRTFETFLDDCVQSWSWKPEDDKLVIKKENDSMDMTNIFDVICKNWSCHCESHGNGDDIYITTPVLSLIGNTDKLLDDVNTLYTDCEWIKLVTLERFKRNFEFTNVPKDAMMIRIHVWNSSALKHLENDIAFRRVVSFFDNKLREMTEDDLYNYISVDMDLASGEIRPTIDDGIMKDPYRLTYVNKYEDEYEYVDCHTITSFKAFDGITVYSWVPKYELSSVNDAAVEKKDAIHPAHYDYKITPLDASFEWFKDLPSDEAILAFNVVKYISRYHKKNGDEDLKKAKTYIDFLLNLRANKQIAENSYTIIEGKKSKIF